MELDKPYELNIGDIIRFNRARKTDIIAAKFEYKGKEYFILDREGRLDIATSQTLYEGELICGYEYVGVVEINGIKVRGAKGKLIPPEKRKIAKPLDAIKHQNNHMI